MDTVFQSTEYIHVLNSVYENKLHNKLEYELFQILWMTQVTLRMKWTNRTEIIKKIWHTDE